MKRKQDKTAAARSIDPKIVSGGTKKRSIPFVGKLGVGKVVVILLLFAGLLVVGVVGYTYVDQKLQSRKEIEQVKKDAQNEARFWEAGSEMNSIVQLSVAVEKADEGNCDAARSIYRTIAATSHGVEETEMKSIGQRIDESCK